MRQIDIEEVRDRLAELLAEVELGKSIVILQAGVPKATLSKYIGRTNDDRDRYGKYAPKTSFDSYFDNEGEISSLF